jgi:invasion protein IalB
MKKKPQMSQIMNLGRSAVFGLAAISALLAAPASHAQDQQQAPVITDTQTKGSWSVRCYRGAPIVCDMTQVDIDRAHNVLVGSVVLAYNPKSSSYFGRFLVPLGVSFDQGMALDVGSYHANLRIRVCERVGCWVINVLPQDLIDAMEAPGASKGSMTITYVDGRKLEIPILLDGFSDSLEILKKLTSEKLASADQTGKK